MNSAWQVKDDAGRVYRVIASDPTSACQLISNRHQVVVVASRESQDPQDAIRIGMTGYAS